MVSETECAYMAGMIDGEGCLSITVRRPRKAGLAPVHECVLVIANNHKGVLDELQKLFGGFISSVNKKGGYALRFSGKALDQVLKLCVPYTKIKKDQFAILLEYRKQKTEHPLSTANIIERERLRQQVMALHGGNKEKNRIPLPESRKSQRGQCKTHSRWTRKILDDEKNSDANATLELLGTHHATDAVATEQTNDAFQVMPANTAL